MSENIESPDGWRNFSTHYPIAACRLKPNELKLLYQIIDGLQKEYAAKIISNQIQQADESLESFTARKKKVSDAFATSVTVTSTNDEKLTRNNEDIFEERWLPRELKNVFYSTISVPQATLNHKPVDRITLFIDFSQPPVIDFSKIPSMPTPNESNFEISALNEAWFILANTKLTTFFAERRSRSDWVHAAGAYDALLWFAGFPLGVWASAKLENVIPQVDSLNIIPRLLAYGYVFLLSLFAFRIIFSYSRWILPKMEFDNGRRRGPLRHRVTWLSAIAALFWPALYDLVKALGASLWGH